MARRKRASRPVLTEIAPGTWTGQIVGIGDAWFGQQLQPPPRSAVVEFSYVSLSVTMTMPDKVFTWPGALLIFAPAYPEEGQNEAGRLFATNPRMGLVLSFNVTRPQYSDMLRLLEAKRFKDFHFVINEPRDGAWPISSWGMSTSMR